MTPAERRAEAALLVLSCIGQGCREAVREGIALPLLEQMVRDLYRRALQERKDHGEVRGT